MASTRTPTRTLLSHARPQPTVAGGPSCLRRSLLSQTEFAGPVRLVSKPYNLMSHDPKRYTARALRRILPRPCIAHFVGLQDGSNLWSGYICIPSTNLDQQPRVCKLRKWQVSGLGVPHRHRVQGTLVCNYSLTKRRLYDTSAFRTQARVGEVNTCRETTLAQATAFVLHAQVRMQSMLLLDASALTARCSPGNRYQDSVAHATTSCKVPVACTAGKSCVLDPIMFYT